MLDKRDSMLSRQQPAPRAPRIAFVACNRLGSRLRTWWPAEALAARGWHAKCSLQWPAPGTADVVISHRPLDLIALAQIKAHSEAGAVTVVDEDDDLTCIPFRHGWDPDPVSLQRHDQAIAAADVLTVSTPRLAEVYGPNAKQVWVLRNHLPERIGHYRSYRMRSDTAVRVGWAGILMTHQHDIEWLAPAGEAMLQGATLTTVGSQETARVLHWSGRVERLPFAHEEADLYRGMARADIGIVPLEPCDFNRSKSCLKALEYMALGKPVVATDLPEQRWLISHGVNGFLAATPAEFAEQVQRLVHDADLRQRMSEAAKATGKRLALEANLADREALLTQLTGWKPECRAAR